MSNEAAISAGGSGILWAPLAMFLSILLLIGVAMLIILGIAEVYERVWP